MRRTLCLVLCTSLVAACGTDAPSVASQTVRGASSLTEAIERASVAYRVPRDVLAAVAYAESRWQRPASEHDHEDPNAAPASDPNERQAHGAHEVGPLHLRHGAAVDTLARARALLSVDDAVLEGDLGLQVAGAAAVLAELGRATGASESDVDSWAEAVARYSGIEGRTAQVSYAGAVWEALRQGRREATFTGETLHLRGRNGPSIEDLLHVEQSAQFSDDYPPARWVPANSGNYGGARGRNPIGVAIHDTEGSYAGTISWFQNPSSGVATHYVIRSSDGEVTQMVSDTRIAWHVANTHWNTNAIGIEHEGFYTAPERWYTEAMYVASARLVRHLCDRYGIPIDREHIFGHYQVFRSGGTAICSGTWESCRTMTSNHVDPGPGWNWTHYMDLVRGGGTTGPMYDAELVGVSYPREMRSGERAVAYIEYRNTGSSGWDTTNTRIGTTVPRDHASRLFDMVNWLNDHRATTVDRATANGAVGRFSFMVNAPVVTADTVVTEHFGLVQEGTAWFGPADDAVTFTITVHPADGSDAGTSTGDGGTSVADASASDSGIPAPSDAGRASDAGADGGGGMMVRGGCGCTAAGTGQRGWIAVVLAGGALGMAGARRRRRAG